MGTDEAPEERRATRVLGLSHPKHLMRAVVDGLLGCGVDVVEVHLDQAPAVLERMHATRANVVLAYADDVVRLGLKLAEQVPVVCVVPSAIVVAAPLVSRRHLRFRAVPQGAGRRAARA